MISKQENAAFFEGCILDMVPYLPDEDGTLIYENFTGSPSAPDVNVVVFTNLIKNFLF